MAVYDEAGIRSRYPQLAYLLNDPEIGDRLRRAYEEDWAPDRFQAEIVATDWWRRTSDSKRSYELEESVDPATFQRKLTAQALATRRIAGRLGYQLDEGYIQHFSRVAMRDGLDEDALRAFMVDEITPLIGTTEASPVLAAIRRASQQWGIVLDNPNLQYWLTELGSGRRTVENLNESMRAIQTYLFPHLNDEFQQGLTFRQVQEPYRTLGAELLELDPDEMDFTFNDKYRAMIQTVDNTGKTRKMSMSEAAKHLRSQGEWQLTDNFKARSDSVVAQLRGVFGA